MKIINEQELIENGHTYIERTYDTGTVEKIMKVDPVVEELMPVTSPPTNAEIMENQIILMDVIATMYEDMLAKGTV